MIPKFRAWDKANKKMCDVKAWSEFNGGEVTIKRDGENASYVVSLDDIILMQSTGLKDKNGVEIFEGDIVKSCRLVDGRIYEYVGQVKFVDFSWNIVDKKDTYDPFYNYTDGYPDEIWEIEIIGNIYQNSELLESVEE